MARFCKGCPEKGRCQGDIVGIQELSSTSEGPILENGSASISFEGSNAIAPTTLEARYYDEVGGASRIFMHRGGTSRGANIQAHQYVDKIERCTEPREVKKWFGLVTRKVCGAPRA